MDKREFHCGRLAEKTTRYWFWDKKLDDRSDIVVRLNWRKLMKMDCVRGLAVVAQGGIIGQRLESVFISEHPTLYEELRFVTAVCAHLVGHLAFSYVPEEEIKRAVCEGFKSGLMLGKDWRKEEAS